MAVYDYTKGHRHQTAVLWNLGGFSGDGSPVVYDGFEIDVRWEDTDEDVMSPLNSTMVKKVANVVVDREIAIGSIMAKGTLAEAAAAADYRQVISYNETPNWDNSLVRRVVGLMRYGASLPTSMAGTGTGG